MPGVFFKTCTLTHSAPLVISSVIMVNAPFRVVNRYMTATIAIIRVIVQMTKIAWSHSSALRIDSKTYF